MVNYDVIVIGAGNGGLAAAATLTKKRIKTLLRCRSGECWFCHSRLASGDVYISLKQDRRRKADEIYGYLHPCCSYPLTDIVIEIPN